MSQNFIKFTKMHGLGNDFIVIDGIQQRIDVASLPIAHLSHRHLGIGFDQLLLIKSSTQADFACDIFNADGSEAEQCGNGMRCVARFIRETNLTQQTHFNIETKAGIIDVAISDFNAICISMGKPVFQHITPLNQYPKLHFLHALSMGNPHVVFQVDSVKHAPVLELGPSISKHTSFPRGTNVGFMEVINRNHIRLRTFERGAGETYACGSNACAAVVAGIQQHLLDSPVTVELTYGNLLIAWDTVNSIVTMTGPAESVFHGEFSLSSSV